MKESRVDFYVHFWARQRQKRHQSNENNTKVQQHMKEYRLMCIKNQKTHFSYEFIIASNKGKTRELAIPTGLKTGWGQRRNQAVCVPELGLPIRKTLCDLGQWACFLVHNIHVTALENKSHVSASYYSWVPYQLRFLWNTALQHTTAYFTQYAPFSHHYL